MANEFAPLFALPSLDQYQKAQKAQDSEGMNLLQRRSLNSSYDFARSLGYKTPDEREIELANKVVTAAQQDETEVDPLKRQYNVLAKAAQSFNDLGMTDYVQKIAPELARLKNQQLEQDKLIADADNTKAGTVGKKLENVKNALTLDADVDKAIAEGLKAGLEMKPWVNQDTGRFKAVNIGSKESVVDAVSSGYIPYVAGQGADKEALSQKTAASLDQAMIDTSQQLAAIQDITHTFKPEYLTLEGRVKNFGLSMKDLLGAGLTSEQAGYLSSFTDFRRNSVNAFNRYIKYITGAQMSQAEAERIQKGFFNADKQGPVQFAAAVRSTAREILGAQKRAAKFIQAGGTVPKLANGKFDGSVWEDMALEPVSDQELDAFLGSGFGKPAEAQTTRSDDELVKHYANQ